jgi:hypothetical protein
VNDNSIPPILQIDLIITLNVLQLTDLLYILILDKIVLTPQTEAKEHVHGLGRKTGMDMQEKKTSTAKELLDVNGCSCRILNKSLEISLRTKTHQV